MKKLFIDSNMAEIGMKYALHESQALKSKKREKLILEKNE
jgi:hypothetical protein